MNEPACPKCDQLRAGLREGALNFRYPWTLLARTFDEMDPAEAEDVIGRVHRQNHLTDVTA